MYSSRQAGFLHSMTRHLKEAQHYGATAAIRAAAEAKRAADAAQFLAQMDLLKAQLEASSVQNPVNSGNWYTTAGAIQNVPGSIIMGAQATTAQLGPSTYGNLTNSTVDWTAMNVQAVLQNQAFAPNADAVNTMRAAAKRLQAEKLARIEAAAAQAQRVRAKLQLPHLAHRKHHGKKR